MQAVLDALLLRVQDELGEVEEALKKEVEEQMLEWMKPEIMDPYHPENAVLQREQSFEAMCAVLEESGVNDPKALTEFAFYSRLVHLKKKSDEMQKIMKK